MMMVGEEEEEEEETILTFISYVVHIYIWNSREVERGHLLLYSSEIWKKKKHFRAFSIQRPLSFQKGNPKSS